MKINKLILINILIFFFIGCIGCSNKELKTENKDICLYNIEDYVVSDININNNITLINSTKYNESTHHFDIYGKYSDYGAEIYENQSNDNSAINSTVVDPKYIFEPFYYKDNTFWGNGLNVNGSQDDNYTDSTTIKALYIDNDDTEYRILFMNSSSTYSIDIRNSDNSIKYSCNITSIKGIIECFEDIKSVIFSDIKTYNGYIYLFGYSIDFSGNQKEYFPFIITIDSIDYSFIDIKKDIDIPGADKMYIDESGNIMLEFYDSSKDITYLYNFIDKNIAIIDYYIHILSYSNLRCTYTDDKGNIFEYDFSKNESNIINTLTDLKNPENFMLINYNNDSYVYLKHNYIVDDIKMSVTSEGELLKECKTDKDFILLEENGSLYLENLTKSKKITINSDIYTNISSLSYDNEYFYLSDNNTVYIYDYYGELYFQKEFRSITDIKCFKNDSNHFIASYDTDKCWNIYSINVKSKDISKITEINKYINTDENTEFINGDSQYEFYLFNNGIVYGYHSNTSFIPLIDLSSTIVSGDIKGIYLNNKDNIIEVVSSYGIKILKLKTKIPNEPIRINVNVSDIHKYSPIIEKYNSIQSNSELVISTNNLSDISTSNTIPDIVISDKYTDIIYLLQMNVFDDIYSDSSLLIPNFKKSIINAYMRDNKLYTFPLTFYLRGLNIYSDEKIDEYTFNLNDFEKLSYKEEYATTGFISLFLLDGNKEFINFENISSNYDSDCFIRLLNAFSNFNSYEYKYIISDDSLCPNSLKSHFLDDKYYFTGIPSSNGNTVYVQSDDLLMISSFSENKEECLNFLNYLLSEDIQKEICSPLNFPINENLYQKCIDDITAETSVDYLKKPMDLIDGNLEAYIPDNRLQNIISDILFSFENGEESAELTAEKLNNKVKLYLNEVMQ